MKKILTSILTLSLVFSLSAQPVTYKFADRDTCSLYLDLYQPATPQADNYCIVFVFGGGFITGERNHPEYVKYAQQLNEKGYTVACIDYRLGLKGVDLSGLKIVKALDKAIQIAVEDLFSATAFLVENAQKFNISPDKIILCGTFKSIEHFKFPNALMSTLGFVYNSLKVGLLNLFGTRSVSYSKYRILFILYFSKSLPSI